MIGFALWGSEGFGKEFARRHGLTYPVALDRSGAFEGKFSNWVPITVLVDESGRFRWAASGFFPQLIEGALDAVLAGKEPPVASIAKPRPQDIEVPAAHATAEGDVFVTFASRRADYRIVDARIEREPGKASHCRQDLPFWEREGGKQTWWLVRVDDSAADAGRAASARLVLVPRYSDAPQWGTHLPRLPEIVRRVALLRPRHHSSAEFIASQLGPLPCGEGAARPTHRLFASHVRFHAARARWLHWWHEGARLKMAEAGARMVAEPFFPGAGTDNVSPWHVKVGDAFAAAGDAARARRHYQLALDTAKGEQDRRSARERLAAMRTRPRKRWQAEALQRTAPPEE